MVDNFKNPLVVSLLLLCSLNQVLKIESLSFGKEPLARLTNGRAERAGRAVGSNWILTRGSRAH